MRDRAERLGYAGVSTADLAGARTIVDEAGGDERVMQTMLADFLSFARAQQ